MPEKIFKTIFEYTLDFREWGVELLGPALPWLVLVSVFISGAFLWGIFYSIAGSGYASRKADEWMDLLLIGDVGKRRQIRIWKRILRAVRSKEMANWKKAILEADYIFDEVLKMSGYRGPTVHDRFKQLPPEALSNYEDIMAVHRVRDRVKQEPDFTITQDEAVQAIKIYEKAFRELGLLD